VEIITNESTGVRANPTRCAKKAKEPLEQAKQKVEEMIEKGTER